MKKPIILILLLLLFAPPVMALKLKGRSIAGNKQIKIPDQFKASYICERPELIPICDNYYLLSLPFRLETDANYKHVEHRAILRLTPSFNWQNYRKVPMKTRWRANIAPSKMTYNDLLESTKSELAMPRLISVFPTRQTLAVACDRTDTVTETFEPKFNGAGTGSITAQQKMDSQWNLNLELALGSFDNDLAQVAFEYLPAKNQHVPTGIMTGYAVVEVPAGSYLWVSPYQSARSSKFFGLLKGKEVALGAQGRAAEVKNYGLLEYAQLHNSELSVAGAKFICDLQSYKKQSDKK